MERIVQTRNPRTGYTKIDRVNGVIKGHKKSPGPYNGIEIIAKKGAQIGCGYCIHEKACEIREPRVNKAKQGCPDWKHHSKGFEKGDKVEIVGNIPIQFRNKPRPLLGTVTNVDGAYILVKPKYHRYECEFYPGELKTIRK